MKKVVVVGGGISGLAAAYQLHIKGFDVTVVEASSSIGGKISSVKIDGISIDTGPDAFLVREPEMKELCSSLGIADELVAPVSRSAKIWVDGRMHALPKSQFLGVPLDLDELSSLGLISPEGIAVAQNDFSAEAEASDDEETVGSLIRRRLGDEVMDKLVGPLLGGINAGDPDKISLSSGVPYLASAASLDVSLIRSIQKFVRMSDRDPKAPVFLTHPEGLGKVVETLEIELEGKIVVNEFVDSVLAEGEKWVVVGQKRNYEADSVILTTPSYVSASIVKTTNNTLAELLGSIRYASMAFVVFAFPSKDICPFDGSGFLVAKSEGLLMTACSWSSSKWEHLGNRDLTFVRVSAGRFDDDRVLDLDDDELISTLLEELSLTVDVQAMPVESKVIRWPRSFPQYELGHSKRVDEIQRLLRDETPGIFVSGAAFNGLGLSACIRDGTASAQRVEDYLGTAN